MTGLIRDETGAQQLVGYVLDVGRGDGRARCSLEVTEAHLNRNGMLHGGIAATLLDTASGATCSLTVDETGLAPFLTVSLTVSFMAAGRPGPMTAVGEVVGGGRSLRFIDARLEHADGTLVATSSGVFKRVRAAGG